MDQKLDIATDLAYRLLQAMLPDSKLDDVSYACNHPDVSTVNRGLSILALSRWTLISKPESRLNLIIRARGMATCKLGASDCERLARYGFQIEEGGRSLKERDPAVGHGPPRIPTIGGEPDEVRVGMPEAWYLVQPHEFGASTLYPKVIWGS